jgi:phosphate:Na+ symporter
LPGRSFKKLLRKHTTNPIKAVLSGTLVTALLQSSSMVSLLVMSFAGAGIIGLSNGIGMILGANLGTTMTGWLVSLIGFKLNIGEVILPFLAVGGLGIIFFKSPRLSNISKLLMGFSIMFLGLNYMKEGFETFAQHIDYSKLANRSSLLFLLFGFLLAASVQSSSAAMMVFLSSLATGMISLHQAVYLVIGADLGTTVTAIIGTLKANSIKKKVGWSQFFFNVFTAISGLTFMKFYLLFITDVLKVSDPLISLVSFHSILNLGGIILLLPVLRYFTSFINKFVSGKEVNLAQKIMLVNPDESHASIEALENESLEFTRKTLEINLSFFNLTSASGSQNNIRTYNDLKMYENEIVEFYIKLQQTTLMNEEVSKINSIVAAIRNAALSAKDLKDIKHNLDELSSSPQDDLFELYKTIRNNQKNFYDEVSDVLLHKSLHETDDIIRLREILKSFYQNESENLYKLFTAKRHRDIIIPSLLNMVREINNSNEALLRAVNNIFMNGKAILEPESRSPGNN